jgi:hypothetical protein
MCFHTSNQEPWQQHKQEEYGADSKERVSSRENALWQLGDKSRRPCRIFVTCAMCLLRYEQPKYSSFHLPFHYKNMSLQSVPCDYCSFGIPFWKPRGRPAKRPQGCACRHRLYCDKICQKRDWGNHKPECRWVVLEEVGMPGAVMKQISKFECGREV